MVEKVRLPPSGEANTGAGRAEETRRRSPVSTPAASPKAALHAYAAEGGGSFAAPTGHALSSDGYREAMECDKCRILHFESDDSWLLPGEEQF
jgi:hypothetical protein